MQCHTLFVTLSGIRLVIITAESNSSCLQKAATKGHHKVKILNYRIWTSCVTPTLIIQNNDRSISTAVSMDSEANES